LKARQPSDEKADDSDRDRDLPPDVAGEEIRQQHYQAQPVEREGVENELSGGPAFVFGRTFDSRRHDNPFTREEDPRVQAWTTALVDRYANSETAGTCRVHEEFVDVREVFADAASGLGTDLVESFS